MLISHLWNLQVKHLNKKIDIFYYDKNEELDFESMLLYSTHWWRIRVSFADLSRSIRVTLFCMILNSYNHKIHMYLSPILLSSYYYSSRAELTVYCTYASNGNEKKYFFPKSIQNYMTPIELITFFVFLILVENLLSVNYCT